MGKYTTHYHRQWQMASFVFLTVVLISIAPLALSAQTTGSSAVDQRRVQLQAELDRLQKEIDQQTTVLQDTQRQAVSLERDVAILNAQIEKARLSIKARNITIQQLQSEIAYKSDTINTLSDRLNKENQSLAELLRQTNQLDDYSLVEVALANENISQFFNDVESFQMIQEDLKKTSDQVKADKKLTEDQKSVLEDKYTEEVQLRQLQQLEQKRIQTDEAAKNKLLKETKGQEAQYQAIIKSKEQSAAEIRSELFSLQGSVAIPFGKALDYANFVSQKTGVRPAVLLAILTEETNLGENVGTGNWKDDMHPTRDRPVFEKICAELGLDPDRMPVSKKPWYGWGGAMGPAQFIPSTWVLYEDRIAKLSGDNPPNPWDPKDAFIAAGILLSDNGADKGSYSAERLAALRYFAGWKNATKSAYAFYGDDVMALATKYQKQIDILGGS